MPNRFVDSDGGSIIQFMEILNAVHSKDLMRYLKSLGVLNDVDHENCTCGICGQKIAIQKITAIYPDDGKVKFCCDNFSCYEKLIKEKELGA